MAVICYSLFLKTDNVVYLLLAERLVGITKSPNVFDYNLVVD